MDYSCLKAHHTFLATPGQKAFQRSACSTCIFHFPLPPSLYRSFTYWERAKMKFLTVFSKNSYVMGPLSNSLGTIKQAMGFLPAQSLSTGLPHTRLILLLPRDFGGIVISTAHLRHSRNKDLSNIQKELVPGTAILQLMHRP